MCMYVFVTADLCDRLKRTLAPIRFWFLFSAMAETEMHQCRRTIKDNESCVGSSDSGSDVVDGDVYIIV